MTRIVFARAVKWRPVRGGIKALFHECSRCHALTEGERGRYWHESWHEDLDALIAGELELAATDAPVPEVEVEVLRPQPWREAWRQVAACLRIRPPRDPRPAALPLAAGRAEQWAGMAGLIQRTTGRA